MVEERLEANKVQQCFCENDLNYKLIFMDCNMPVKDGFVASSEIKRLIG